MESNMQRKIKINSKLGRQRGTGLIEYTIIVAMLSIISIAAMKLLGSSIQMSFGQSAAAAAGYIQD